MVDISTDYLGLKLRSPLVASSSGLTATLSDLKKFEENGVGAVVLKSIFEEEIVRNTQAELARMSSSGFIYPETMEYLDNQYDEIQDPLTEYIRLIKEAKRELSIPVIASVNCVTSNGWMDFAEKIEHAGADAIELNIFVLPSDFVRTCSENESIYFDVATKIMKKVTIPVSVKIGYYSASLGLMVQTLSETGVKGITLFNRVYTPDFDVDTLEFTTSNVLSTPSELSTSLRWVAILSGRVKCDIAASTGVHDGNALIKQILAGAKVADVASAFYINGIGHARKMLSDLRTWMQENSYSSLAEFRGKMSRDKTYNPAAFERVQFMKYFKDR